MSGHILTIIKPLFFCINLELAYICAKPSRKFYWNYIISIYCMGITSLQYQIFPYGFLCTKSFSVSEVRFLILTHFNSVSSYDFFFPTLNLSSLFENFLLTIVAGGKYN